MKDILITTFAIIILIISGLILPSLVLAQLKATTLMIQQKKWKEYERYEQSLIERKNR
jgi:hypothetical protein